MSRPTANSRPDRRRRQRLDKKHVIGLPQLRFVEGMLGDLRAAYDHPPLRAIAHRHPLLLRTTHPIPMTNPQEPAAFAFRAWRAKPAAEKD